MASRSITRIVCISDTHGQHRQLKVPDGDILIHAGDFMRSGRYLDEIDDFDEWLGSLPHLHKVVIAGNHDLLFESHPQAAQSRLNGATYLENSGAEVLGLKLWGSPVQPAFNNWAFNVERGAPIRQYWEKIPHGIDVLITHGPLFGRLDKTDSRSQHLGCEELARVVSQVGPRLHVFGHIHGGYGQDSAGSDTVFVNAAVLNERYLLTHEPIVIDLPQISPKQSSTAAPIQKQVKRRISAKA